MCDANHTINNSLGTATMKLINKIITAFNNVDFSFGTINL
ncbi:hypothetical protein L580_2209 [Serratia fonticola AU-P3(3)]|nr:hypothetical protein L580_2209 [Serratia fonticola AU-P3(3)]